MPYARSKGGNSMTRKPAVQQPNMQGTRGGPGRGGVAARPAAGGGAGLPSGVVLPGRKPTLMDEDPRGLLNPAGGLNPGGGASPPDMSAMVEKLKASPTFQAQVLQGADPQQAAEAAGAPPMPGGAGAPKPAWQQLQEMGVGGQGSAAANKAKLAEIQAAQQPTPGGVPVGAQPMPGGPPPSGGIMDPGQARGISMPGGGFGAGGVPIFSSSQAQGIKDMFGGGNMGVRNRMKQNLMALRQPAAPAPQPVSPMPVQNIPQEQPIAGPFQRPGVGRASMPVPQTPRR